MIFSAATYREIVAALVGISSVSIVASADVPSPVNEDAPSSWKPYDGAEIKFDVFRKGDKEFGTHTVSFEVEDDGTYTATTRVSLKAGLGPITVFRYKLQSKERWSNDMLVSLEANTVDDGDKESVVVRAGDNGLTVDGSGFTGTAPASIIPSSHWNI